MSWILNASAKVRVKEVTAAESVSMCVSQQLPPISYWPELYGMTIPGCKQLALLLLSTPGRTDTAVRELALSTGIPEEMLIGSHVHVVIFKPTSMASRVSGQTLIAGEGNSSWPVD